MIAPDGSVSEEQQTMESLSRSLAGGRYRLMRLLGSGAMGSVRLAEDTALHRRVAIKTVKEEVARNSEIRKRIERECLLHAKVGPHPNIVTLFDKLEYDDEIHLIMEYIDGETLQARLERNAEMGTVMPPTESISIAAQVLDALSRIHAQGIVHRDIKPSNIMLTYTENGTVCAKLMDFGVSRLAQEDEKLSRLTTTGTGGPGTPLYMAPEQIDSKTFGEISFATDVYAMGIMLYQLLTGKPPFRGTITEVLNGHLNLPMPPLFVRLDGVLPETVENLLRRALAKKSAERIQSAKAFRDELLSLTTSGDTMSRLHATIPLGSASSAQSPVASKTGLRALATQTFLSGNTMQRITRYRRSVRVLGVGVAVFVIALIGTGYFLFRGSNGASEIKPAATQSTNQIAGSGFTDTPLPAPSVQPSAAVPPVSTAPVQTQPGTQPPAANVTVTQGQPPVVPAPTPSSGDPNQPQQASIAPTLAMTGPDPMTDPATLAGAQTAAAAAAYTQYTQTAMLSPGTGSGTVVVETATVQAPGEGKREHVVVPGDTLSKIGAKYSVQVSDIQWWNNILNPSSLSVGQTLKLYPTPDLPPKEEFMAKYAAARKAREASKSASTAESEQPTASSASDSQPTLEHTFKGAPVPPPDPPKKEEPRRRGLFRGLRGDR